MRIGTVFLSHWFATESTHCLHGDSSNSGRTSSSDMVVVMVVDAVAAVMVQPTARAIMALQALFGSLLRIHTI